MDVDEISDINPDEDVTLMMGMFTVFPRERSHLIEISITHTDPKRAAVLATLYAEVYVDQNLESGRGASRGARQWLEQKIDEYGAHRGGARGGGDAGNQGDGRAGSNVPSATGPPVR